VPEGIPIGTPVQAHVADDDPVAPPGQLAAFHTSAAHAGAEATLHTYPNAGHFYTDPSLPDYSPVAARTWQHIDALLDKARQRTSR
jgi:dienelactone hydrolase